MIKKRKTGKDTDYLTKRWERKGKKEVKKGGENRREGRRLIDRGGGTGRKGDIDKLVTGSGVKLRKDVGRKDKGDVERITRKPHKKKEYKSSEQNNLCREGKGEKDKREKAKQIKEVRNLTIKGERVRERGTGVKGS